MPLVMRSCSSIVAIIHEADVQFCPSRGLRNLDRRGISNTREAPSCLSLAPYPYHLIELLDPANSPANTRQWQTTWSDSGLRPTRLVSRYVKVISAGAPSIGAPSILTHSTCTALPDFSHFAPSRRPQLSLNKRLVSCPSRPSSRKLASRYPRNVIEPPRSCKGSLLILRTLILRSMLSPRRCWRMLGAWPSLASSRLGSCGVAKWGVVSLWLDWKMEVGVHRAVLRRVVLASDFR